MWKWFKSLIAIPKVVNTATNIVDSGVRGLDALYFTSEEKAQHSAKVFDQWLEAQKILTDESSIRSVTRRRLACVIMGVYLSLLIACAAIYKLDPSWAGHVFAVSNVLTNLVLGVGFFYFGSYALGSVMKK